MEHQPDYPQVKVKPPYIYASALVCGFVLEYIFPSVIMSRPEHVWLGVPLLVAGVGIVALAMRIFKDAGTPIEIDKASLKVVDNGLYRYSRNPVYIGLSLLYGGIGLTLNSVWILILLMPVLLYIRVVVAAEESYLTRKFGDVYLDYVAKVRRWI